VTSVLIAEGEPVTALDLERALERFGYDVVGAVPSGEEALAIAADAAPDVAVLDVRLAGPMDGIELAGELRRRAGTPAVFLSANSDEATLARAAEAGAYAFLTKPFDGRELRNAVELAVRQHASRRRLEAAESLARSLARSLGEANALLAAGREALERAARRDGLTGLSNRREFDARLGLEAARAFGAGAPLGVALLDVDHFKAVNDRFGHLAGDAVLRGLGARLGALLGPGDLLARYGGEELAAVLPGASLRGAYAAGERLRRCVAAAPFEVELAGARRALGVTVSVGVAALDPRAPGGGAGDVEGLLARADAALYAAKAGGRNRTEAAAAPRGGDGGAGRRRGRGAARAPAGGGDRGAGARAGRALGVLVVDDDAGVGRALARALCGAGHRAEFYAGAAAALARLAAPGPPVDALVTDLAMPALDGLSLLREARALRPGLPAVVLTGRATVDAAVEAIELGVFRFLRKPVGPAAVVGALGELGELGALAARRGPRGG
jgi:diguanylate cyclase (GGDEF)-like protein